MQESQLYKNHKRSETGGDVSNMHTEATQYVLCRISAYAAVKESRHQTDEAIRHAECPVGNTCQGISMLLLSSFPFAQGNANANAVSSTLMLPILLHCSINLLAIAILRQLP